MRKNPQPNEIYRHFKGNLYRIITLATHSETRETMVVYQALYGDYQAYVRELSMFMSETDKEKYPQAQQQYRFELIPQILGAATTSMTGMKAEAQEQADESDSVVRVEPEPEVQSEREPEVQSERESEPQLDPGLMEFLDAETYRERLNLLAAMQPRITDEMINTMAIALDVEIGEGDTQERYASLKNCLLTMEKYEGSRLR